MINNVTLVGRIGKELELKYTPSGVANLNFSLAVTRPFSGQNGEKETDWINVVVWRKSAESTANFCKKGSLIGVVGRIQTRNYESDGRKIYVTEVVAEQVQFLDTKRDGNTGNNQSSYGNNSGNTGNKGNSNGNRSNDFNDPFANDGKTIDISDDDLPF